MRAHVMLLLSCAATACGGAARTGTLRVVEGETLAIDGLGSCEAEPRPVVLDGSPVAVLVHGNQSAPGHLAALAEELQTRGFRPVCFRWHTSGRILTAARAFDEALEALESLTPSILVVGHSLGGLVSRRALVSERSRSTPIDLVTVATPFAGVASASTCSKVWLRILSLGSVAAICRRLSHGATWRDFHPESELITEPGTLGPSVRSHLHVITDERDSCRRRRTDGSCARDDFVFSTREQAAGAVRDPRLTVRPIRAGHGEVVADPAALLELLPRSR